MADNGKMQIVYRNISELKPAEYNPRQISRHDFTHLKKSLEKFNAVEPAVINTCDGRKDIIIGGHQRIKAALELGHKTFPCYEIELTPEKERELNIRLNKNVGTWDMDLLANNFDTDELHEFGFTDLDLGFDSGGGGLTDDDDVPEAPKEAKTKPGDLYKLGEHRLLCGDSTKADDVERLMDGEKVDMVFTDPPYGIDIVKKTGAVGGGTEGKYRKMNGDESIETAIKAYNVCVSMKIENLIFWGGNYYSGSLPNSRCWIVWDKQDGKRIDFADCELAWTSFKTSARIFTHI